LNNVFHRCPHRVHLGRREQNVCDGNLYDRRDDSLSFEVAHPAPGCRQNLAGWRAAFGLDKRSDEAVLDVTFDATAPAEGRWGLLEGTVPAPAPTPAAVEFASVGPHVLAAR
jgi:hypothetical protein